MAFGISGALVPLVEVFTDSLIIQYYILAGVVLLVMFLIFIGPNPEHGRPMGGGPRRDSPKVTPPPFFNIDSFISYYYIYKLLF